MPDAPEDPRPSVARRSTTKATAAIRGWAPRERHNSRKGRHRRNSCPTSLIEELGKRRQFLGHGEQDRAQAQGDSGFGSAVVNSRSSLRGLRARPARGPRRAAAAPPRSPQRRRTAARPAQADDLHSYRDRRGHMGALDRFGRIGHGDHPGDHRSIHTRFERVPRPDARPSHVGERKAEQAAGAGRGGGGGMSRIRIVPTARPGRMATTVLANAPDRRSSHFQRQERDQVDAAAVKNTGCQGHAIRTPSGTRASRARGRDRETWRRRQDAEH